MRLVFAGTPELAARHLEALLASRHQLAAVYTQPDRPAGRGRRPAPSPVKRLAEAHGLPVRQPATLRPSAEHEALAELAPELMVVVAYGLLLPRAVLGIPPRGCLNVHASLLPRWRGAAPIQRALLAGDRETGVSLMEMEEGLDTGPVLLEARCPILPADTAGSLHDRLAELGARVLPEALDRLEAGTLEARPQDEARATHAPKLSKEEARLDWTRPAVELERAVRAFDPWPVAHTLLGGEPLRVWRAEVAPGGASAGPGTVTAAGPGGIDVATGAGLLRLTELQRPGGRRLPAAAFLAGRPVPPGERLGV